MKSSRVQIPLVLVCLLAGGLSRTAFAQESIRKRSRVPRVATRGTSDEANGILVLRDKTRVEGDVRSLLSGSKKTITTADGKNVGLADAVSTHLAAGEAAPEVAGTLSTFAAEGVVINLTDAFIIERVADDKLTRFLQVDVEVSNRDERRYLHVVRPTGFFSNNYRWRLRDDVANKVRHTWLGTDDRVGNFEDLDDLDRIEPEKRKTGSIVFENPLPKTEYLELDLAPQMFEFSESPAFIGASLFLIPFDQVSTPESRRQKAELLVLKYAETPTAKNLSEAVEAVNLLSQLSNNETTGDSFRTQILNASPRSLYGQLPPSILAQLPASVLCQLPVSVLSQLPASVLSQVIKELPPRKNSIGMAFKPIIGGTFTMGDDTWYAHQVTLTQPFELGVYEVTQAQYQRVMGTNPSHFNGPQNPVEKVSWDDAVEFCRKLSDLSAEKTAGYVYRLPTEAEWEYACRAGTKTVYSFGGRVAELGDYAWHFQNSGGTTHPVGQKKPNLWGLYGMYGNVSEWCQDWYGDYARGSVTDPTGPSSGSRRVLRGGDCCFALSSHSSAGRLRHAPGVANGSLGFRVIRTRRARRPEAPPMPEPRPSAIRPDFDPITPTSPLPIDGPRPNVIRPNLDPINSSATTKIPPTYRLRSLARRAENARKYGGTEKSERAVESSLEWLAMHQSPEGYWDADGFSSMCPVGEKCAGRSGQIEIDAEGINRRFAGLHADPGVTGLSVLAFLGAGYTHEEGQYADHVDRALSWLIRQQEPTGFLGGKATRYARNYCHAIATYAMAEALGMQSDRSTLDRLRRPLERAVGYIVADQNQKDGGWRYLPGQQSDMSIFGWQLMALKSADIAGIPMPPRTRRLMIQFLKDRSLGERNGLAAYSLLDPKYPALPPSAPMTAESLFCKQMLGLLRDNPQSLEAIEYLQERLPRRSNEDLYYWYYGTLAMYQYGGQPWQDWNAALRDTLIADQRTTGHVAGSWDPHAPWGAYGGRVFSTTFSTLCLEVYYRFLPPYQFGNDSLTPDSTKE